MARRPSKRTKRPEMDAEINLLPVLNLMVGLVPPLLLMASFVHLAVIDSSLPKIDQVPPKQEELPKTIPLVLTVELFENQIKATCTGGITREELKKFKRGESTCGEIIVEKVDDEYDWVTFSKKMVELKDQHPDDESVIIRPVDAIRYESIVNAMDYTRQCHPELEEQMPDECKITEGPGTYTRMLFPNVNLAFAAAEAGGLIQ